MDSQAFGQDLLVGIELGHYRIVKKIGAGGMEEVYRAHDEHLARDVAIKVLPPGTLIDESARKHFHKEALILSQLNHPNIATIHDFDTQQGVDFLVMEYIPGITLSEKVAAAPLPEKDVLRLGVQLAEGLAAAHGHGVVHRDLKPGNLQVTSDGRLKILDFGLAKLRLPVTDTVATESFSETHALAGTVPYMAPEQLLGEEIDARTDIHGAGSVLYEMATGQRPFAEVERSQLIGAILHRPPVPPTTLNSRLSPKLEDIILKCLEKEPENRYQSAKELAIDLRRLLTPSAVKVAEVPVADRKLWKVLVSGALILVASAVGGMWYFRSHQTPPPLTEKDTIVLADFDNTTGEPVFDYALKQALAVQLAQSPFLNTVSPTRVKQTLAMMGRPVQERLNEEVGREVCQRTDSRALLTGSIASLGNQYILALKALTCATGDVLVQEQVQVAHKEEVLDALGKVASRLRRRLGESLNSIHRFDTPIAQATTSSLEALQAYSLALKAFDDDGNAASIPFLQRAIELDPNFAMAYARLGNAYGNLGQAQQADDAISKAYALRNRVTEVERYYIESHYYVNFTGELDKASQVYGLWKTTYPRAVTPRVNQGSIYYLLGQYGKAAIEQQEALRLSPNSAINYGNLADCYLRLDRLEDAKQLLREAQSRNLGGEFLLETAYLAAFLGGDQDAMQRSVATAVEQGEAGHMLLAHQSETEAYYGRLKKAREDSRRAQESARRIGNQETALSYQIEAAIWEAELGDREQARRELARLLPATSSGEIAPVAALAWARIGDTARAQSMASELGQRFPKNTLIRYYWLPTIKAGLALRQSDPAQALEFLQTYSESAATVISWQ